MLHTENYFLSFVEKIESPYKDGCMRLFDANRNRIIAAPGSTRKHQVWEGGYVDHLTEMMMLGQSVYDTFREFRRRFEFSKSQFFLAVFLHDLENRSDTLRRWQLRPSILSGHTSRS